MPDLHVRPLRTDSSRGLFLDEIYPGRIGQFSMKVIAFHEKAG